MGAAVWPLVCPRVDPLPGNVLAGRLAPGVIDCCWGRRANKSSTRRISRFILRPLAIFSRRAAEASVLRRNHAKHSAFSGAATEARLVERGLIVWSASLHTSGEKDATVGLPARRAYNSERHRRSTSRRHGAAAARPPCADPRRRCPAGIRARFEVSRLSGGVNLGSGSTAGKGLSSAALPGSGARRVIFFNGIC